MLTYQIISKAPLNLSKKSRSISQESGREKAHILQKNINRCTYREGDLILLNGNKEKGQVLGLVTDPTEVVWQHWKPFFISIVMSSGKEYLAHPSQLRKQR
jgi:hypothetical protein